MPTYKFECPVCKSTASVTNPISEGVKTPKCLSCNIDMQRQFDAPSVTFKGTGWGSDR